MSTERVEQRNMEEQNNIQYNPYADMPVNLENNNPNAPSGKFGFIIEDDDEPMEQSNAYGNVDYNQHLNQTNIPMQTGYTQEVNQLNIPLETEYNKDLNQHNTSMMNDYSNSNQEIISQSTSSFVSSTIRTDNEYANSDVIDASALSIFGVNPNKQ